MSTWQETAGLALWSIADALGPRGQWPGWAYPDADPAAGGRDVSPPLTALGVLALQGIALPGVAEVIGRSRVHIELTVLPGGLWRYYANVPPDTDDTAMCALALGPAHHLVAGSTTESLLASRTGDGRFPTWLQPGWKPAFDAVANAHVIAVLGQRPETRAAIAWLAEVIESATEVDSCRFYRDPLDLHMAAGRALAAGVTALEPAIRTAAMRARTRLAEGGLSPFRTAQAMVVAARAPDSGPVLLPAAEGLIEQLGDDGLWAADTLYQAANTAGPGLWHYQSRAVISALCVRALAIAHNGIG